MKESYDLTIILLSYSNWSLPQPRPIEVRSLRKQDRDAAQHDRVGDGLAACGNAVRLRTYLSMITFMDSDSRLLWICDPQQTSDTAEKLRVTAFQPCIRVDSGQRCHQVMDLRFLWTQTQIHLYSVDRGYLSVPK